MRSVWPGAGGPFPSVTENGPSKLARNRAPPGSSASPTGPAATRALSHPELVVARKGARLWGALLRTAWLGY